MIFQANHIVRLFADFGQGLGRRDGNRKNERLWRSHARGAQGRSDGRARGDSVVDDDRDAVLDVDGRAIAEIAPPSALDFGELLIANSFELGFVDRQVTNDVLITDNNGSGAVDDGTHCQFRPPRHADFAHQDEAQRRIERGCDFRGHRHAAARQRQYDRILARINSAHPTESGSGGGKGVDPEEFRQYFITQGRFTAGVATKYGPSMITAEAMFQHLADGFPVGMRFHSAPVVRLADAR